jgi:primosomal protein N' (replication factor Y)
MLLSSQSGCHGGAAAYPWRLCFGQHYFSGPRGFARVQGKLVRVAVGRPLQRFFTYRLPASLSETVEPGRRLVVPFGRGRAVGFCLGEAEGAPPPGLKDVQALLDEGPIFSADLLRFLQWVASYYRYPLGEVLRTALPPGLARPGEAPATREPMTVLVRATEAGRRERPRGDVMRALLDYLAAAPGEVELEELEAAVPGARQRVRTLAERGLCEVREEPVVPDRPEMALVGTRPPRPTEEQAAALRELTAAVDAKGFAPFLLHGVTGSGKTEVYLRAIAHALDAGGSALVLVPEIGLTPQLVGRFRSRFGEKVAVLHSGLREAERLAYWRRLWKGDAPLAVGVRSAIFAPLRRLSLIVVDEEHDGSFKQDDKLRYNARDLAVVRAQQAGCPVVLGSATPSLETLHNAQSGRYRLLELRHRVDDRPMPAVEIVDMRLCGHGHVSAAFPQLAGRAKLRAAEARRAAEAQPAYAAAPAPEEEQEEQNGSPLISPRLAEEIDLVLDRGHQAILFLNRRGQSTYHLCLGCGQALTCPSCAVSLTLHGSRNMLMCHYCGRQQPLPDVCPSCGGPIEPLGMGTERLEEEIAALFPKARLCRLDRDSATQAEEVTGLLASFARGEKDILIGTQMVAKGHDFPGVTLVGVLLADVALNLPDFRASERTFQLLAQVAGRAGRGREPGKVIVQSFNPEAPAIARVVGHDFGGFAEHELELRRHFRYPPFARLLSVRIDGIGPKATAEAARALAIAAGDAVRASAGDLRLIGPAPAPLSKLKGRSRWQMLLKGPTARSLIPVAEAVERAAQRLPSTVRMSLDVDPLSLL